MSKINVYQRELYHHGILGQKWGRRNGPPYPLKTEDHSMTEKKKIRLTDKQKEYIKIGVYVVGNLLIAYGGYKVSTNPKLKKSMARGYDAINKTPSIEEMIANSGPEIVKR